MRFSQRRFGLLTRRQILQVQFVHLAFQDLPQTPDVIGERPRPGLVVARSGGVQLDLLTGKAHVPQQLLSPGVLIVGIGDRFGASSLQHFLQCRCGIALLAKQRITIPDRRLDRDPAAVRNGDGDWLDSLNGQPVGGQSLPVNFDAGQAVRGHVERYERCGRIEAASNGLQSSRGSAYRLDGFVCNQYGGGTLLGRALTFFGGSGLFVPPFKITKSGLTLYGAEDAAMPGHRFVSLRSSRFRLAHTGTQCI